MTQRQRALEAERREILSTQLEQQGLYESKGTPYMPLLVTAVLHKVSFTQLFTHCQQCIQQIEFIDKMHVTSSI